MWTTLYIKIKKGNSEFFFPKTANEQYKLNMWFSWCFSLGSLDVYYKVFFSLNLQISGLLADNGVFRKNIYKSIGKKKCGKIMERLLLL